MASLWPLQEINPIQEISVGGKIYRVKVVKMGIGQEKEYVYQGKDLPDVTIKYKPFAEFKSGAGPSPDNLDSDEIRGPSYGPSIELKFN